MFTIHDGHAVNTVDAPVNLKFSAFNFAASNDNVESYIMRIPPPPQHFSSIFDSTTFTFGSDATRS